MIKSLTLLLLGVLSVALGEKLPYSQRFSDQALDQRLCMSMVAGLEYYEQWLSTMVDKYILFYTTPERFGYKREKHDRFKEVQDGKSNLAQFGLDLVLQRRKGDLGKVKAIQVSEGTEALELEYPVFFYSKKEGKGKATGHIDFRIRFEWTLNKDTGKWALGLNYANQAVVTEFLCSNNDQCAAIKSYLESEFTKQVLTFKNGEHPYDQPTAVRDFLGMIGYINDFGQREIETVHPMVNGNNFAVFFNCRKESIEDVLAKPIAADVAEFSFSQNIVDNFGLPQEYFWTPKDFLELDEIKNLIGGSVEPEKLAMVPDARIRFTKDPLTVGNMTFDPQKLQKPQVKNHTEAQAAERPPHPLMDKIEVNQNLLVEISSEGSALTVIPIQVNWHFLAKYRPGAKYKYGQTQTFKFEFVDFTLNMMECQHLAPDAVLQDYYTLTGQAKPSTDDGDEFEDDEPAAPKVSALAGIVCSSQAQVKEGIKSHLLPQITEIAKFDNLGGVLGFLAQYNEYYPMPEKWMHHHELCSGIETRQDFYWFDSNRAVVTYGLNKRMIDAEDYCDSIEFMREVDPRLLYDHNDPGRQERVENRIVAYENDVLKEVVSNKLTYISTRVDGSRMFDHYWMGRQMISPFVHYFTSYSFLKEYCRERFPGDTFNGQPKTVLFDDNCALAHSNERGNLLGLPHQVYRDMSDMKRSRDIKDTTKMICTGLLYLGLLLHLIQYRVHQTLMLWLVFWINTILSLPELYELSQKFGIDYVAYIQQAAAVYHGETDYTKLSSTLGPCFYPAGHIWHYIPVYWLHLQTEEAEVIMKFVHILIHSGLMVTITALAYVYFRNSKLKIGENGEPLKQSVLPSLTAQLIGFIMLANKEERSFYSAMFNDEVMVLYLALALFYSVKGRPFMASFFVTLGLSVKAGVILLLPAFLGQLQYNYGTITLVKCLALIIGFQVVVALPFLLGESTVSDYIIRSKLTGAGRNGIARAAAFWDYLAAHQSLSIFWTFVPEEVYFDKSRLADPLKIGMVALNVYHFFIRQWCWPRCFENLFKTFNGEHASKELGLKSQVQVKKTLDILLVGYFIGIVLMPGANGQFQFWFMAFVPLLLAMTGYPVLLTFWITEYFYPINGKDPKYQHWFLLALVAYLITVGTSDGVIKAVYKFFKKSDVVDKAKKDK